MDKIAEYVKVTGIIFFFVVTVVAILMLRYQLWESCLDGNVASCMLVR